MVKWRAMNKTEFRKEVRNKVSRMKHGDKVELSGNMVVFCNDFKTVQNGQSYHTTQYQVKRPSAHTISVFYADSFESMMELMDQMSDVLYGYHQEV